MPTGYPYFTIQPASGGFRARFFGANDELVWWTEVYPRKATAQQAINLLKGHAATAPVFDRT